MNENKVVKIADLSSLIEAYAPVLEEKKAVVDLLADTPAGSPKDYRASDYYYLPYLLKVVAYSEEKELLSILDKNIENFKQIGFCFACWTQDYLESKVKFVAENKNSKDWKTQSKVQNASIAIKAVAKALEAFDSETLLLMIEAYNFRLQEKEAKELKQAEILEKLG